MPASRGASVPKANRAWPGRKQVFRSYDADGRIASDIVTLEADAQPGESLLVPVMRAGKRMAAAVSLADIRRHAAANLARLPEPLRQLKEPYDYRVEISSELHELAAQVDRASSNH